MDQIKQIELSLELMVQELSNLTPDPRTFSSKLK